MSEPLLDVTADADLATALTIASRVVGDEVDPADYQEFDY